MVISNNDSGENIEILALHLAYSKDLERWTVWADLSIPFIPIKTADDAFDALLLLRQHLEDDFKIIWPSGKLKHYSIC